MSEAAEQLDPEDTITSEERYYCNHWSRWEDDGEAIRFCLDHPDGATLAEIAQAFDPPITRQRVEQIIRIAEAKLQLRARLNPGVRESYEDRQETDRAEHPLAKV